ncbi:hypothetical protein A2Y99_03460 [Candidatus Gottesmanbacteria bacterium RBG_13_37_7]|uniref:Uncharacterized protein n=1 Tax=Candidatus Gottesmanbacteria bacterium RBG_13_37_7 TaxID=1798369 RepID=A0A1F5YJU8_9BACT|nr:MAG: hypothetical protein A2Y99_03460 [Candidatus Gottesmanbacteria bacterium RBG_13_37_7]
MNRKELAILALITLLTVIAWVSFDVYHARTISTITEEFKKPDPPLTPIFNSEIISKLKNREE